ncbi:metallophosphoesterase [Flagellimonas lutimaris]|uniref:metallophosphoesterase n=1 Tax=Flagellimonas lutimaris TaxID=475082 RepID=UPI003F5CD5B3
MKIQLLVSLLVLVAHNKICGQELPRTYKAPEFDVEWRKPSKHPDRIVLSFGEDPATSASVTWRTTSDIDTAYAEIAIASAAPKFWRNAKTIKAITTRFDALEIDEAEVRANYHSVWFTDLKSDTTYAYRVGDGKRWSEWIQFKTAPKESKDKFSFLYVGDTQNFILELWSRLIRESYKKAPDAKFIVHAGDLVNNAHNEQQWQEWFDAGGWIHASIGAFPIPGNHEYRNLSPEASERSLSVQWKHQFTLPENGPEGMEETAYYMDYQNMRIIGLNSNVDHEKQAKWVEKLLSETDKDWIIVTFHHPLFSASDGRDNKEWRALMKPIFDKYGVDLVLQGHDHSYARGRVSPNENVLDGVNLRDKTGTVYVVSVSGGKMYGLRKNGWEGYDAERDRAAENTQLFQVITIEDGKLSFESYTAVGELYDAFDLIKKEGLPNEFVERNNEAISERRFSNTIPYEDLLPQGVEQSLLSKYPGFQVNGVRFVNEKDFTGYKVRLKKGDDRKTLTLDVHGKVLD